VGSLQPNNFDIIAFADVKFPKGSLAQSLFALFQLLLITFASSERVIFVV